MDTSDSQLVNEAISGSEEALTTIYQKYRDPLFSYIRSIIGPTKGIPVDVEGIVQETFISALASLSKLKQQDSVLPWLKGIARNKLRKALNDSRKEQYALLSTSHETSRMGRATAPPAEDEVLQQYGFSSIRPLLEQIHVLTRNPLELSVLEGLSYEEVSNVLQIPISTVRGRIFNTKKKLVELILRNDVCPSLRNGAAKALTTPVDNLSELRSQLLDEYLENQVFLVLSGSNHPSFGSRDLYTCSSPANLMLIMPRLDSPTIVVIKAVEPKAVLAFIELMPRGDKRVRVYGAHSKLVANALNNMTFRSEQTYLLKPEWLIPANCETTVRITEHEDLDVLCTAHPRIKDYTKTVERELYVAENAVIFASRRSSESQWSSYAVFVDCQIGNLCELALNGNRPSRALAACITSGARRLLERGYYITDNGIAPDCAPYKRMLGSIGFKLFQTYATGRYSKGDDRVDV